MTTATRSTAIAAFASRADAARAIRDLLDAGFTAAQLGLVLPVGAAGDVTVESAPVTVCLGGMFRKLIGTDIPDGEIRYYEEDLEEGRPLAIVRSADRYQEAIDLLHRCGGEYLALY